MVNSLRDLEKAIQPYIEKALELTGNTIYEILKEKVETYYNEPVFTDNSMIPNAYKRTDKLKNSLFEPIITKSGNTYSMSTGFKDNYLTFEYPGKPNWTNNIPATGQDVLEYFNSGSHGGTVDGEHNYWDEALEDLGGEQGIINLFKQNCKKVGLPIK